MRYRQGTEGVQPVAQTAKTEPKKKIPYIPLQKATESMTDGQKAFIRDYNLMIRTLRENELMEEK